MASSSACLSDGQIQCDVCSNTFTDLVSPSCGHSFCDDCIDTCWENKQLYECPRCIKESSHVLCDVCCGNKLKAAKSCLQCVTSYCEKHLDYHKTAPRLMRHKLINPVENLEDYICSSHEKPLEMFCKDDRTFVCVFCTETEHKMHDTVAIEEESSDKRIQLEKQHKDVKMMIRERRKKIKWIQSLVKINKRNHERDKACSTELLFTLISCIERHQSELLEAMEQKQKAAENQAEDLMKDMEQEITELKRRDTELEQLSDIEDHLRFLKLFSSACRPLMLKSWSNVSISTDLNTEILRKTLTCLQENVQTEVKTFLETSQDSVIQGFNFKPTSDSSVSDLGENITEPNKADKIFVFGNTDSASQLSSLVPESSSWMQKERSNKDASAPFSTQQDVLEDFFSKTKTSNALQEGKIYFTLGKMDKNSSSLSKAVKKNKVKFDDLTTIQKLYAVHVVLDSNTAHPKLLLSKNGKQVTHGETWTDVPNNPERFDFSACVLGTDGYSCGRFYFEVEVGEEPEWGVGVARESINRKGKITVSPEKGFWTIKLRNRSEYVTNVSHPICLSLKQTPQKVGVFVDYEEGLVSFYDVEAKCLIFSFTGQSFTEKLHPFLSSFNRKADVNPNPLIISTVSYLSI